MSKDKMRQLKQEIKKLQKENEFLQVGIESRENAYNYVCEQRARQEALTQELVFLLLYMEAIERLVKKDSKRNVNAMIIEQAINKFRRELTRGLGDNFLYTSPINDTIDLDDDEETTV